MDVETVEILVKNYDRDIAHTTEINEVQIRRWIPKESCCHFNRVIEGSNSK